MDVKIIADEPVLAALRQHIGAKHLQAGASPDVTGALLVWAHGRGMAGGIVSEHGGLKALQRIIADNRSQVERYLVIGFLPASGLAEWGYLLAGGGYCQLPGSGLPARETWAEVSGSVKRTAAEREMELISAGIRHMFVDDARPAARIALGAYACADVSFNALTAALRQLRLRDHLGWQAIQESLEQLPDLQSVFRAPYSEATNPAQTDGKVLLIEDQPVARESWQFVLNMVFEGWARKGAQKRLVVEVDSRAYRKDGRWDSEALAALDLVLLDYELGVGTKVVYGGDLIHGFKQADFSLPIILFTASDEAAITKWCLRNGASDYFVKELPERFDRQSIKHYRTLKRLLRRQLALSEPDQQRFHSTRSLYHRYAAVGARCAQIIDKQQYYDWKVVEDVRQAEGSVVLEPLWNPVDFHLRQAFRFLLCDRFWAEAALGATPSLNQAYFHAHNAAEAAAEARRAHVVALERKSVDDWTARGTQLQNLLTHPRVFPLRLRNSLPEVPRKEKSLDHFEMMAPQVASRLPREGVMYCLAFAIELAILIASELEDKHKVQSQSEPVRLPTFPRRPGPAPTKRVGPVAHYAEAELAAVEYAQQAEEYLSRLPAKKGPSHKVPANVRLLHLDDRNSGDNPWLETLQRYLAFSQIDVEGASPCAGVFTPAFLRTFDIILLDMRLPTERAGLAALARIKKLTPEVPVVMFTSSYASRPVRMSLAAGAADYFLTRSGLGSGGGSRHEELLDVLRGSENHWRSGVLRKAFQSILDLEQSQHGSRPNLSEYFAENMFRSLKIAWSYLWWAEFGLRRSALATAWDNWIIEGLGCVDLVDAHGTYSQFSDGCYTSFLLQCGLVAEGVEKAGMKTSVSRQIVRARHDAVHAKDFDEYTDFEHLCGHLSTTIDLTKTLFSSFATRSKGANA